MSVSTPIVFIIYKRPETTQRVFQAIRAARPQHLLVIADGPKTPGERAACAATRAVIDQVDWDCEVLTDYSDENLGLRARVASGLDWAFSIVEEAIILEDDCLPGPSFFRFCDELLAYYRDDPHVMHISGNNFVEDYYKPDTSYYFSRYPHVWGWATWRRAWQLFDVNMRQWAETSDKDRYLRPFDKRMERNFWRHNWNKVINHQTDTWSQQWVFACLVNNGLSINPNTHLVKNIGFGAAAAHTRRRRWYTNLEASTLSFPLIHPTEVARDTTADSIDIHRSILNPPSGNVWLDRLRKITKAIKWELQK